MGLRAWGRGSGIVAGEEAAETAGYMLQASSYRFGQPVMMDKAEFVKFGEVLDSNYNVVGHGFIWSDWFC